MELRAHTILISIVFICALTGLVLTRLMAGETLGIVSPLGDGFTDQSTQYRFIFDEKTTAAYPPNEWFPKTLLPQLKDSLDVTAKAYAVMERTSGELLLAKDLTVERPIASLTKILTAIVVLEKGKIDQELTVNEFAANIGEATMGLTAGEKLTIEELLYGMMLPSGNDAAETLAFGLGGRMNFITSMNEKSKSLGLFDSYFFNSTGLDGDTIKDTSFSTPLDLLALTNYALTNPLFATIVSTYNREIPYKEGRHKAYYLYNILQLDRSYPGIKGIKPGVTDFAGETLASYAENRGKQIIVILLGSSASRDDAVKIYDFIFPKLGVNITRG